MYDEEYENEIIEQEFDDTGVVYEKPIELDIFAEDAWDDSALLAAFHQSLKMHPESNIVNEQPTVTKQSKKKKKYRTFPIASSTLSPKRYKKCIFPRRCKIPP